MKNYILRNSFILYNHKILYKIFAVISNTITPYQPYNPKYFMNNIFFPRNKMCDCENKVSFFF